MRARLLSDVDGLDGRALRKHGIFQPIFGGPADGPRWLIISPGKIRSRFEPIVTVCCWDEAHRECCCGVGQGSGGSRLRENMLVQTIETTRVPRPKPPWPPIFFNSSWTGSSRETGRSRNEGNYQATSVDVLRTLRGGKAGGEHGHHQSMHPSVGTRIATAGRLQVSGASQEEKRLQDAGWFAKLTPGAPISVQRRGDGTERL